MNNTKAFALQDSVQVAQVLNEVLNEVLNKVLNEVLNSHKRLAVYCVVISLIKMGECNNNV